MRHCAARPCHAWRGVQVTARDHPARRLPGLLLSAHRAGAMDQAFKRMGEMLLEDMALIDRDLPPQVCRRAERETVGRLRSRPVARN